MSKTERFQNPVGSLAVLGALGMAVVFAAPGAEAKKREPAPITYGGGQSVSKSHTAPRSMPASSAPRREFRYPDQPEVVYGGGAGPRAAASDMPPIAFKSYDAAVGAMDAGRLFAGTLSPPPAVVRPTAPEPVSRAAPRPVEVGALPRAAAPAPVFQQAAATVGPAYEQNGTIYIPAHEPDYDETGKASWYGDSFHGKLTASGEVFDQNALTAAHPTLPIPSMVQVTNVDNGRSVMLRINDRGPFVPGRLIDVSRAAADQLGFTGRGHANVRVQWAGPAKPVDAVAPAPAPGRFNAPAALFQASAPAPGDGFVVQVGAFSEVGNALRLKEQLAALGPSTIEPAKVRGSDIFRVVMGPWSDRAAAEAANSALSAKGMRPGLVRTVS